MDYPINKSEEQWRKELDPDQYYVLREKGTERPFTGKFNSVYASGTYYCAGCDQALFDSSSKFDSGCGWPSFDQSKSQTVAYIKDSSHGMIRTEIVCSSCGGHLGHVFDDGPTPTKQRYCVNSLSLKFDENKSPQ
ncbi:MAG: peptide-methionine (R)-S-oxide reductase MsrB [Flavobacteriaceae bacterium]|jgi:peptide-methionine (R)-S-oxide reductase|nr:peptide-methionine (R)-S-oxide reductase MsrB [Flavobacteriaceae bacterium]MDG1961994.1 peptide-methionine (R)-S-oxide reductase MsrB [Flavobacteriaceae bacterium]